jgi:hypothetical protein
MLSIYLLYSPAATPLTLSRKTVSSPVSQTYIVAFPMKTMAERIRKSMGSPMYLTHHISSPSQHRIDQMLYEMGMDPRSFPTENPYTESEAYLHVPRLDLDSDSGYSLFERSLTDILAYPFVKNMGLVLPLGIADETPEEWVLEAQLVEPSANLDLFRRDLERLVI